MAGSLKQFRNPELSLWQSAVDQVVAKRNDSEGARRTLGSRSSAASISRPDLNDSMIRDTATVCEALEKGDFLSAGLTTDRKTLGIRDVGRFCATAAFGLAKARVKAYFTGDNRDLDRYQQELERKFGPCDARGWATCIEEFFQYCIRLEPIPYRTHDAEHDFVLDGRLPASATVARIADWGTGQDAATKLLQQIKMKAPDVVIYLGDIYYSGTEREAQEYFYATWQDVLGLPKVPWGETLTDLTAKPATFTLSGNHDMYAGGKPYYALIDILGQPASYFCLRNDHWQFVALDTGLKDANPVLHRGTSLQETEVTWLKDRVAQANGRKTLLLSHHQLFSAYEKIAGRAINRALFAQVKNILPQVTAWFWGHEHDLIIYKRFADASNVLGHCLGHGAIPVDVSERISRTAAVPVEDVKLAKTRTGNLFQNGYVLLRLRETVAEATYYQYDVEADTEAVLYTESL
jgi:3',5'-cyclic AMP phosphodiesterase CpdA